jgi:hypothetical protein
MIKGEIDYANHTPDQVMEAVRRSLQELKWQHEWSGNRATIGVRIPHLTETSSVDVAGTRVRFDCRMRTSQESGRLAVVAFFNRLSYILDGGPEKRWQAHTAGLQAGQLIAVIPVVNLLTAPFQPWGDEEEGTWDPATGLFHIQSRQHPLAALLILGMIALAFILLVVILAP